MSRPARLAVIVFALVALTIPASSAAQDDRRVGVVMAAPLHIGLLLPVTERVAVRPVVSWSWTSTELDAGDPPSNATYGSDVSSARFNVGASLLFFLGRNEGLRTYVAPGYAFSRSSVTSETRLSVPGLGEDLLDQSSTQTSHEGRVVFGAEHTLGTRFRVFGECGVVFSTVSVPTAQSALVDIETRGRAAGTTGAVGVVLLF